MKDTDKENTAGEPSTDKAPFLIIFDDNCDKVKCYVDSEPNFGEKPIDAILLLLATFIWNLKSPDIF